MTSFPDPKPLTLDDVFEYLHEAVISYLDDPPTSEFEQGYAFALAAMRQELLGMSPSDRLH